MSSKKTFSNVSQPIWNCVQQTSVSQHGTVYTPPPPSNQGSSSTSTAVGHVDLNFNYDPTGQTVAYEITHKPFVVTEDEIWNGISSTIKGCS